MKTTLKFKLIKGKQVKVLKISPDETMSNFDLELRKKWRYDTFDHCSSFYKKGLFGKKEIAGIYPDGRGKNQNKKISDFKILQGEVLFHVFDYGEWKESEVIFQGFD